MAVREMISSLPRQSIVRDPELALAAGASLLASGEREQAGEYLRLADHRSSSVRSNRRIEFGFARMVTRQYEARSTGDCRARSSPPGSCWPGWARRRLPLTVTNAGPSRC